MKKSTRKELRRMQQQKYTFWDFLVDVLFFIPELIILPFRMLIYLGRGIIRLLGDFF